MHITPDQLSFVLVATTVIRLLEKAWPLIPKIWKLVQQIADFNDRRRRVEARHAASAKRTRRRGLTKPIQTLPTAKDGSLPRRLKNRRYVSRRQPGIGRRTDGPDRRQRY